MLRLFTFSHGHTALPFFTFLISRSNIACVTFLFAGSASVIPAQIAITQTLPRLMHEQPMGL